MSGGSVQLQRAPDCAAPAGVSDDQLHDWALRARAEAAGDIVLRLVGEAEGRALNMQYRGGRAATNVLSFPAEALPADWPADLAGPALGDIVLCLPVVEREARAQCKSLADHLAHLVIHGVLHLRGYDHDDERQAAAMEALEVHLLAELGIADPYTPCPGGGDD